LASSRSNGVKKLDLTIPERTTLNDQVYKDLRRLMMSGGLRPGQSISIRSIANVIGVSPMPVRSALQRLVIEGALEVQPNRSFALPVLTAGDFSEIASLRASLEGMATHHATPNLRPSDIAKLHQINRSMFEEDQLDPQRYLELNRRFHFLIYDAANQPRLLRFIENLWLQVGPLLNLITSRKYISSGRETHDMIVDALADKDADAAERAVKRDLLDASALITQAIERGDFADA
jgi:DNA-binding GntR family transcriptional regulator